MGNMVDTANNYAAYFDEFKNLMKELNLEDASSIRICKDFLESHETRNNLAFIFIAQHGSLPELICKLEGRNVPLYEAISLLAISILAIWSTKFQEI